MDGTRTAVFMTAWGPAGIAWNQSGLVRLALPGRSESEVRQRLLADLGPNRVGAPGEIAPVIEQVKDYFQGRPVRFQVRLDLAWATPFQRAVLAALRRIPYGQTRSYAQVARAAGAPGGARAVGQANAANQIPIIIPCHRVIKADGALGGFSGPGGPGLKQRLLDLEKRPSSGTRPGS